MNEQRQQAYIQLIQSLLSCPSGEEPEILAANQELIDTGLLQMVEAVAQMLLQEGDENNARWLEGLANYLREGLKQDNEVDWQSLSEEEIQTYLQFLGEVLLTTADSGGDAQVVYPLLAQNTDKLDGVFAEILRRWGTNTLGEVSVDEAESIAVHIGNFSNRIQQFPLGNKANNMEIAITGYEIALEVYTFDAFPQQWATTQNNLAIAYRNRIRGERADNLENAIACYQEALKVRTFDAFPQQWATTQNNLATAYSDRIRGERADNLENAIACYQNALKVRTFDAFPQDWAMTQNNLANAYLYRIRGERADNLELAIACYQDALNVYTFDAFPYEWATTQNNLANAYGNRIRGERADNLEIAITCYQDALNVYTFDAFPYEWATTQSNLAIAYRNRIRGERADNLENAIACYQEALKVRTFDAFPQDWATTQNNLAAAYSDRIRGERADNLELAIACYQEALKVRTRKAFPQSHAETLFNLGRLYQGNQQFTQAYETFTQAITTVELLRGEIFSGEEAKRKQAEEWNQLYLRMVEVCLQLGEVTAAIEYIEQSKTRNLAEFLTLKDLYPGGEISPQLRTQLQQLRKDIAREKQRLTTQEQTTQEQPDYTHLNQLRQDYQQLYPYQPIPYQDIHNLLDGQTAIIQWYIFNDCFRAFILTKGKQEPEIWTSSPQDLEKLEDLMWDGYIQPYATNKPYWRNQLNNQLLRKLAQILHIDEVVSLVPNECDKVIFIPHRYLHLIPLHALEVKSKNSKVKRKELLDRCVMDLFRGGVSYAPSCQLLQLSRQMSQQQSKSTNPGFTHLFAIQNPTEDLEFTDIEVETIAPTFQPHHILKHAQATESNLNQSPHREHLQTAHWLHFSCHGNFNFTSPQQSFLQLADTIISPIPEDELAPSRWLQIDDDKAINVEKCLTLEDIFQLNLANCRLVTLSACETAFTDYSNTSDEYISLSSGFIAAGANSIISTLWAVEDFATALFTIKLYENLYNCPTNISLALHQTQVWLRQVTQQELIAWIRGKQEMKPQHRDKVIQRLEKNYRPEQQPFKQPYFWAAFSVIGG
ncbi:MAG: CHAT domain-containing protein [Calothrix sp. MO_192.B10]|nr:CHAT domain-containing protein [Calothrix sp. MO_192.B10]